MDELTTTTPAVQAAMLAVALDRVVGDLVLPDEVRVVAGANPPDRAADGWELSPPLANRFCHVTFEPSVEEWLDGMTVGWSTPPASRAITPGNDKFIWPHCAGLIWLHPLIGRRRPGRRGADP